ncbi:hypothetical protein [Chitinophaga sp. CB10]|uniref:hypothetical protein n=1 Tax=Chitinophaga sp. CB10 TaxID=1891659 RepID=UPI0025BA6203|nr:hypothetical protein [Chitinophaga sp. CB10]
MKAVFFIAFALALLSSDAVVAQTAHDAGICKRMQDSLHIDEMQLNNIMKINMEITRKKQQARLDNKDEIKLRMKIQTVENTRDSLFSNVLTVEQFRIYKAKKGYFLNGGLN